MKILSNTHGELIGASRLASVTPGLDSDEPLVERPPQTVVQVLGLADLVVAQVELRDSLVQHEALYQNGYKVVIDKVPRH